MKLFRINLATVFLRFILMMTVVIVGIFSGQHWLALLALPILLSAMLGVSLKTKPALEVSATRKRQRRAEAPMSLSTQ